MGNEAEDFGTQNSTKGCSHNSNQPCLKAALLRAKDMVMSPGATWDKLKSEDMTINQVFMTYAVFLVAVTPVCEFIRMTTVGRTLPFIGTMKWPLISGLVTTIVTYALGLATIYIAAVIMEKLAPKFDGALTLGNAAKLFAFSMAPVYLGGVFQLIPYLSALGLLCGLYGLYLFYQGIPKIAGVTEKRVPFFLVTIVALIVTMMIVGLVVAAVSPSMFTAPEVVQGTNTLNLPGGVSIDMNEAQKTAEQLQKMFPQQGTTGN
ncbi:MAG: YIP1 family protein [Deltaproteobacteria bacterium]|nr:YIP1 family protein [Deltaproteobacteria bacterium]